MGKKVGYIRLESCLDIPATESELIKEGCKVQDIIIDKTSTKDNQPPDMAKCLNFVSSGDTLMVSSLDELGLSMTQLVKWINELGLKGIHFKCIRESVVDTTSDSGEAISEILSSLAQVEKDTPDKDSQE